MKRATIVIAQSAVSRRFSHLQVNPGFLIPARGGLIYIELHTSRKDG